MIRVTVELVSAVHPSRSKVLGVATIANVGGDAETGDYNVRLSKWSPRTSETWKTGSVKGFPRLKRGAWDLLYLALRDCVAGRNGRS